MSARTELRIVLKSVCFGFVLRVSGAEQPGCNPRLNNSIYCNESEPLIDLLEGNLTCELVVGPFFSTPITN